MRKIKQKQAETKAMQSELQDKQLLQMGVPIDNKVDTPFNPIINYDIVTSMYTQLYSIMYQQLNASYFIWSGLEPYNMTSQDLNHLLYMRGILASFYYKKQLYITPIAMQGKVNYKGRLECVTPIPSTSLMNTDISFNYGNGTPDKVVDTDNQFNYGTKRIGKDCAILRDYTTQNGQHSSRNANNQFMASQIAKMFNGLSLNVDANNKKFIMYADNSAQARVLDQVANSSLASNNPFMIITKGMEFNKDIFTGDTFVPDKYFNAVKNLMALNDFFNGVENAGVGNEKGERQITGELAGIETRTDMVAMTRLANAQEFARQTNLLFGTNVQVRLMTDKLYKENESNDTMANK